MIVWADFDMTLAKEYINWLESNLSALDLQSHVSSPRIDIDSWVTVVGWQICGKMELVEKPESYKKFLGLHVECSFPFDLMRTLDFRLNSAVQAYV